MARKIQRPDGTEAVSVRIQTDDGVTYVLLPFGGKADQSIEAWSVAAEQKIAETERDIDRANRRLRWLRWVTGGRSTRRSSMGGWRSTSDPSQQAKIGGPERDRFWIGFWIALVAMAVFVVVAGGPSCG